MGRVGVSVPGVGFQSCSEIYLTAVAFPVALQRAGHTVTNKQTWSFKSSGEADIKTPKDRNIEN